MISQLQRLPSRTKLQNPLFIQTTLFALKAAPNNQPSNRFAFVVGKRIDKRAVVRNRLRRVLREIVLEQNKVVGWDMLFSVRRNFIQTEREQIIKEVVKALSEIA